MIAFTELVEVFNDPVNWEKARPALATGVQRGDSISELEYVGVSSRTLTLLEESVCHIIFLEDLLGHPPEDLWNINHVGPAVYQEIMDGLGRYHLLAGRKIQLEARWDAQLMEGIEDLPRAIRDGEIQGRTREPLRV